MSIDLIKLFKNKKLENISFKIVSNVDMDITSNNQTVKLIVGSLVLDEKDHTIIGHSINGNYDEAIIDLANKVYGKIDELLGKDDSQKQNTIFSKETINAMNEFKKSKNIQTDEKLMNYISSWNPKITKKSQLNEALVKEFLNWVK